MQGSPSRILQKWQCQRKLISWQHGKNLEMNGTQPRNQSQAPVGGHGRQSWYSPCLQLCPDHLSIAGNLTPLESQIHMVLSSWGRRAGTRRHRVYLSLENSPESHRQQPIHLPFLSLPPLSLSSPPSFPSLPPSPSLPPPCPNDAPLPPKPTSHEALFIQARISDMAHWTSSFWLKTLHSAQVIVFHTRKNLWEPEEKFLFVPRKADIVVSKKKERNLSGLHGLNKTYLCTFCHSLRFSIMSVGDVFCTLFLMAKVRNKIHWGCQKCIKKYKVSFKHRFLFVSSLRRQILFLCTM